MQLTCPECGETLKSDNINIQEMVAVCPTCDSVFRVNVPEPKAKRRKVYQPHDLTLHEDETLHMAFRTNFRLDRNEVFLSSLLGSVFLTFVTGMLQAKGELAAVTMMFGSVALLCYYWMALTVFNKTHIDMTEDAICVSRQPLPTLFNQTREISLFGVESITSEETDVSKKEAYDTPRYNVWANTIDGSRKVIVSNVTEAYGLFIAQSLNERLHYDDSEVDTSRLMDLAQPDVETDAVLEHVQQTEIEK